MKTDDELWRQGLLSICQELHMHCTGAGILYHEDAKRLADYLNKRIAEWKQDPLFSAAYDAVVFALITTVLSEYREDCR